MVFVYENAQLRYCRDCMDMLGLSKQNTIPMVYSINSSSKGVKNMSTQNNDNFKEFDDHQPKKTEEKKEPIKSADDHQPKPIEIKKEDIKPINGHQQKNSIKSSILQNLEIELEKIKSKENQIDDHQESKELDNTPIKETNETSADHIEIKKDEINNSDHQDIKKEIVDDHQEEVVEASEEKEIVDDHQEKIVDESEEKEIVDDHQDIKGDEQKESVEEVNKILEEYDNTTIVLNEESSNNEYAEKLRRLEATPEPTEEDLKKLEEDYPELMMEAEADDHPKEKKDLDNISEIKEKADNEETVIEVESKDPQIEETKEKDAHNYVEELENLSVIIERAKQRTDDFFSNQKDLNKSLQIQLEQISDQLKQINNDDIIIKNRLEVLEEDSKKQLVHNIETKDKINSLDNRVQSIVDDLIEEISDHQPFLKSMLDKKEMESEVSDERDNVEGTLEKTVSELASSVP